MVPVWDGPQSGDLGDLGVDRPVSNKSGLMKEDIALSHLPTHPNHRSVPARLIPTGSSQEVGLKTCQLVCRPISAPLSNVGPLPVNRANQPGRATSPPQLQPIFIGLCR